MTIVRDLFIKDTVIGNFWTALKLHIIHHIIDCKSKHTLKVYPRENQATCIQLLFTHNDRDPSKDTKYRNSSYLVRL